LRKAKVRPAAAAFHVSTVVGVLITLYCYDYLRGLGIRPELSPAFQYTLKMLLSYCIMW